MGDTPITFDEQLDLIAKYPQAVKAATLAAEDRLVDLVGTVSSNQAAIREWKKGATAEMSDGERGKRWMAVQKGAYQRSYNTDMLLAKLARTDGGTLASTLAFLLQTKVITLKWNWTPLKKLIRERMDIRIIKKEIEDGDLEWDIGEWWKPGYLSFKPVETEEE